MGGPERRIRSLALVPIVTALSLIGTFGHPAGASGLLDCAVPGIDDRCEVWVGGPADPGGQDPLGSQWLSDAALSPSGKTVFLTGTDSSWGFRTVAYSTTTGRAVWATTYRGPQQLRDYSRAVAASPDGRLVFVVGSRDAGVYAKGGEFLTVAYDAATGERRWSRAHRWPRAPDGEEGGRNSAYGLASSPDGRVLYVTGSAAGGRGGSAFATVSYEAATGRELWRALHDEEEAEAGYEVAVSPDGTRVFVTGQGGDFADMLTMAYDARTGKELWAQLRWAPESGMTWGGMSGIAVAPDGSAVFSTGSWATAAYEAATGKVRWIYPHSADRGIRIGRSLAIAPDGRSLFVGGIIWDRGDGIPWDAAILSLGAATGQPSWVVRDRTTGGASSLALSPDGSRLLMTGGSTLVIAGNECATTSMDVASGATIWRAQYSVTGYQPECQRVLASADGKRVYTAGNLGRPLEESLFDSDADPDYLLLGYDT